MRAQHTLRRVMGAGSAFQFFLITYLASWSCWFAAVAIRERSRPNASGLDGVLVLIGTVAPAGVALALTAFRAGEAGLRAVWSHLLQANVRFRWYLFAILYMPAVKAAVAMSYRLITGKWPPTGHEGPIVIAAAIVLSTPVQAGEEIGWRGYALPRVAARWGLGRASIVVGILWGVWHLPLFLLPGADKYGQSFAFYVAGVVAFSIAISWLYGNTQGSLLLTMLMHSAFNQTIGIISDILRPGEKPFALGASFGFVLTVAWMWAAAGYFLTRMPQLPRAVRDDLDLLTPLAKSAFPISE